VSFHNFTLPEDRCVRLLVKKLGRGMPENVVREELEYLNLQMIWYAKQKFAYSKV
jgi:hypothetical protein